MLKKISIRKITVTTCSLIIICLLYFFPSTEQLDSKQKIVYEKENSIKVFLLDKYEYVSMVNINISEKEELKKIKKSIDLLTKNNNSKLPNNFKALIPKNTTIKDLYIKDNVCVINFSKEINNIEAKYEEKMYEAITYTLTSFKNVNKVKILIEGKEKNILDRTMGINKIYDINSLKDMSSTTIYYLNDSLDEVYYTPVTKIENNSTEKVEIIIEELKSSLIYQSNLSSYLNTSSELKDYKIKEKVMYLTFNDKIFDNFKEKEILEEVKYTINMSIKDNYDVEEVIYYVNKEEITKTMLKTLEN